MGSNRRLRFFVHRSPKLLIPARERQIIVPFKPISLGLIIFLLAAVIILIFRSDLFLIHKVDLNLERENSCLTKEESLNNLDVIGRSLIFLDTETYQNKLLSKFICLKSAEFKKSWPDKLAVNLVERQPVIALQFENWPTDLQSPNFSNLSAEETKFFLEKLATSSASFSTDFYLVDETKLIFKKSPDPHGLPVLKVSSAQTPAVGQKAVNPQLDFATNLLAKLSAEKFEVKKAQLLANQTVEVFLKDELRVLFTSEKDLNFQTTSLQLILGQAKIKGAKFSLIDFRFAKPIVSEKESHL